MRFRLLFLLNFSSVSVFCVSPEHRSTSALYCYQTCYKSNVCFTFAFYLFVFNTYFFLFLYIFTVFCLNNNRIFIFSLQLVLFCEGTRLTPEKHKVSVEYAEKKGVEPLKHHLLPRTKGFAVVRKEFEGKGNFLCFDKI